MEAPRQFRFSSLAEITRSRSDIRAYLEQATGLEKTGARGERKQAPELALPEELQAKLAADPALHRAFAALTPGRQKGYVYQIAAAKQTATRASRVDKYTPRILAGKGLRD